MPLPGAWAGKETFNENTATVHRETYLNNHAIILYMSCGVCGRERGDGTSSLASRGYAGCTDACPATIHKAAPSTRPWPDDVTRSSRGAHKQILLRADPPVDHRPHAHATMDMEMTKYTLP